MLLRQVSSNLKPSRARYRVTTVVGSLGEGEGNRGGVGCGGSRGERISSSKL